jgi:AraC-like DNA-binding protein
VSRHDRGTFSAIVAGKMAAYAGERGLDIPTILREAGIPRDVIGDPEKRVELPALYRLWESMIRRLADPALPIQIARTYRVEDLYVMGFALMTSPSTREAVRRAIRYYALLTDSARWELDERGETATIRFSRGGALDLGHRVANEAALAVFLHVYRQTIGEDIPAGASFRHLAPADTSAHRRFFRGDLKFGAAADSLVLDRSTLDRIPRTANPQLGAFFERHAETLLSRHEAATIADQVRDAIAAELASGQPSMAVVARRLGASERSLRRRLQDEGIGFRELCDDVLRVRAEALLRRRGTSVTDVAFLLGFSDSSAFARACKRWFGRSPSQLREGP